MKSRNPKTGIDWVVYDPSSRPNKKKGASGEPDSPTMGSEPTDPRRNSRIKAYEFVQNHPRGLIGFCTTSGSRVKRCHIPFAFGPLWKSKTLVRKAREPRLHHKLGVFGAGLAAVDGGFSAPLGGEAAHSLVYVFVEAQQVADYTAIQVGAVGVGVGQVGGFQLPVAESR